MWLMMRPTKYAKSIPNVPNVFFDSRVIKGERQNHEYKLENDDQYVCVIKIFELALYTLINREDEYMFELNQINLRENKDKLFIAKQTTHQSINI